MSYHVESWHFHWKFWKPLDVIGGPLRFGSWAVVVPSFGQDEPPRKMTALQVTIKRQMGLIR